MLYNIKVIHLQRVFHGIRFKVNNEDWLSVIDSLFLWLELRGSQYFLTVVILHHSLH